MNAVEGIISEREALTMELNELEAKYAPLAAESERASNRAHTVFLKIKEIRERIVVLDEAERLLGKKKS
jgi:hypothetical protein